MAEWPESRQLAAQYQSPGPEGIGFAQYASTGTVTPSLWANINVIEAKGMYSDPGTEGWTADMQRLRALLAAEGVTEKRKVKLQISFTEVIPRSVEVEAELDVDDIESLESGYGFSATSYAQLVRDKFTADGESVELLHDEVDHIEVLDPEEGENDERHTTV